MINRLFLILLLVSGLTAHAQTDEFNVCKTETRVFRMEQQVALAGFYVKVGNDSDFITEWDVEIIDQSRTVTIHNGEKWLIFRYLFADSSVAELHYRLTNQDSSLQDEIVFIEGLYQGSFTEAEPVAFQDCRVANIAEF